MKHVALVCSALLCVAGLSGCETGDSGDYPTDQIICNFSASVETTGVTVQASFWKSGTGLTNQVNLVLTADDSISVNGTPLKRVNGIAFDYYEAALPAAEKYVFVFTRADGTFQTSSVDHVAPLQITGPVTDATVSRSADMNLLWTNPAGGLASVSVSGEYLEGFSEQVADSGTYVLPAGTLVLDADAPSTSVAGSVSITRTASGTMAEGLKGSISVSAGHSIAFVSTP